MAVLSEGAIVVMVKRESVIVDGDLSWRRAHIFVPVRESHNDVTRTFIFLAIVGTPLWRCILPILPAESRSSIPNLLKRQLQSMAKVFLVVIILK